MADPVQTEGTEPVQGGEAGGDNGLYDLSTVPDELRSQIEPHLKAIEANATKKFKEAAEYRKSWEPYEKLGVNDLPPEQLEALLSFARIAEDDDQFSQWFDQVGTESGLFEKLGYAKPEGEEGEEFGDLTAEQVKEIVQEAVQEQVNPLNEKLGQQEQEQLLAQAEQEIGSRLAEIEKENDLPEGARDAILRFAQSFAEDEDEEDPIGKGFEEYKRIVAQGESGLFKQKVSQPAGAEGPGQANTAAEPITSFDQAEKISREKLRASLST